MSIEEDFDSKPLPQVEKKWPIDVEKLSLAERDEIVARINALKIREKEEADLQAQLEAKMVRNDRFIDNNIAIENMMARSVAEPEPAPTVLAGGVQTSEEPREPELVPKAAIDAMTEQVKQQADELRLSRMIAENRKEVETNEAIETVGAADSTVETRPEMRTAPEIPPQIEVPVNHPAFEKPHLESGMDTAARLTTKVGGYVQEKIADSMQYGFLGKLEPKLDRLGIRLFNAPRRMLFEGLYKWRSERAFVANQDLEKANQAIAEKEKTLAEQDAKCDAFLANEKKEGWSIGSSSIKLESERAKAVKRIEAAKQDRDAKHVKLESWNTKKTYWENKQKDVAREMVSKVDQRLINTNADFIALTSRKENIENQLQQWESARTKAQEHLTEMEAKLKSAGISYAEEEDITGQIEEIQKILAEGNKKYKDYVGRKNAADAKMGKINTYLGGWNTFKNELGRTGENNRYDEPGNQEKVKVGNDRTPAQSYAPQQ